MGGWIDGSLNGVISKAPMELIMKNRLTLITRVYVKKYDL